MQYGSPYPQANVQRWQPTTPQSVSPPPVGKAFAVLMGSGFIVGVGVGVVAT